ncbi:MAG: DUF4389 domain-containing protein [Leptospiraceae bacterium]|nr:DUF4389 domain-containing protein [Leptospiraceae bacterium]MCB1201729.1 DUF4389 domain-containing protein [Leptospiraceae bacterium]
MRLNIQRQESYSRGELLLRTFFGLIYIGIPHLFLLAFFGLWGAILGMIAWYVILFTGKYPQSWFEYQVKLQKWNLRLNARLSNMLDGYPAFGIDSEDPAITLEVPYPEELSRGKLLLKTFFGFFYVLLPHMFVLMFRQIWGAILQMITWYVVLFTGNYPENWFNFQVENIRWATRVNLYMANMTDEYPPFNGKE